MDIKCNETECYLIPPSPPSDLIPFASEKDQVKVRKTKKSAKSKPTPAKRIKVGTKSKGNVSRKTHSVVKGRITKSSAKKYLKPKSWIKKAASSKKGMGRK